MTPVQSTKGRDICFCREGDAIIIFSPVSEIKDEVWDEYIELTVAHMQQHGPALAVLNYSPRSTPNTTQRKRVLDAVHRVHSKKVKRVALMTDSILVRGGVTALGWMVAGQTQVRAFRPDHYANAIAWLAGAVTLNGSAIRSCLLALTVHAGFAHEVLDSPWS